ncbi:MAG: spermidine/putrescine ABC transporter substrate-binding protein [Deltaproteobacteria bacterium]|nr:spermidine/putrescine ABC transporter substrate-binding protein [Candidatus Zymogenaceae bacterium]
MDMNVVRDFEETYHIDVIFEYYGSENEMVSLLMSNQGEYDLVVASGTMVESLIAQKLIMPIQKGRMENISKISYLFRTSPSSSIQEYSVPFLWGTTGIAVNREQVKDENPGWEILFDERYAGKIDMLNDIQEDFSPALKIFGASINSDDEGDLSAAEELLLEQKKIVNGYFDPITIQDHLEEGSIAVAYIYSGDCYMAMEKNKDIEYVIPDSGAPIWLDCWVIPSAAPHVGDAHTFIDFVLGPENIAQISNYVWNANTVRDSMSYLNPELLQTPMIYLDEELMSRCEYYEPLSVSRNIFMNRVWAELQQ